MEKKNTGLKVLVIILSILVLCLAGYIIYDKVLNKDNDKCVDNNILNGYGNNNSQNGKENIGFVKPSEHVEIEENIKSELLDVFNFVFDYNSSLGVYCGDANENDTLDSTSGSEAVNYIAATKYSSYDEMIKYLKKYMTENVIYNSKYMSSDNYIEKDGKLYCPVYDFGKGGNIYQLEDIKIKYSKPWMNGFYVTFEVKFSDDEHGYYELYDITFEKKNNKWVIISYDLFNTLYY